MAKNIIVKTDFDLIKFVSLVQEIAEGFFDEDEYVPHIGELNAMRLYYNECVVESKFDIPHNFEDANLLADLVRDKGFMCCYNRDVCVDGTSKLDFANAYSKALDIVEYRKGSAYTIVNILKRTVGEIVESVGTLLSSDNIEKLADVAKDMSNGSAVAEKFLETYDFSNVSKGKSK